MRNVQVWGAKLCLNHWDDPVVLPKALELQAYDIGKLLYAEG